MFLVDSGVKQSGVMSLILFRIYLDGLLNLMDADQIGCFIGRVFVGCLAYADDIVLLTPTTGDMRNVLAICDSYAKDYNLVFNVNKNLNRYCLGIPVIVLVQ